ncbi:arsenate reductase (glutaredoxin) [Thioalkalivibrio sp.]|uniref:arsenate reductase (glutaredoxin) n=1 Tax=Thioalkalivibrio sp. TaxID=2093813 RepID=UPI003566A9A2
MSESPRMYHNPRCSKSRAALALLRERGIEPEIVEYLKTPPDRTALEDLIAMLGVSPRNLLRTSEAAYRELGLADAELPDERIIQAMVDHPKLIERPIVIHGGQARIGRPPERVLEIV